MVTGRALITKVDQARGKCSESVIVTKEQVRRGRGACVATVMSGDIMREIPVRYRTMGVVFGGAMVKDMGVARAATP